MRYRMCEGTGLGNPSACALNGNFEAELENLPCHEEFLKDLSVTFKIDKDGEVIDCDLDCNVVKYGVEPAYRWERLEIIGFNMEDKSLCFWKKGIAFGVYGSQIGANMKIYSEYRKKSKFVKFIDKWYDRLKSEIKKAGLI